MSVTVPVMRVWAMAAAGINGNAQNTTPKEDSLVTYISSRANYTFDYGT